MTKIKLNFSKIEFKNLDGTKKVLEGFERSLGEAIYNLSQERHLPLTLLAMDMYKGKGGEVWESIGDHNVDSVTLEKLIDFVGKLSYPDSIYFTLVEYLTKVKDNSNQ